MREDKWIVEKGNRLYKSLFLGFLILAFLVACIVHRLPQKTSETYLIYMNVFSILFFISYRIYLLFDQEYMSLVYQDVKKAYWFELPFFPCNTAELLYPFALYFHSRVLLAYCFFMGIIGPLLALMSPLRGYERESLWKIRMLGFYGTHFLCLMNIPILISSRIYIPTYADIPKALLLFTVFSFLMFILNLYIDSLHLGIPANYFFNMDPEFHPVFRMVYKYIPYRFLFQLPLILATGVVMYLFVFILHMFL